MRIVLIQLALIVAVILVGYRVLLFQGQRTQAMRRIGWLVLGLLAIASILFPQLWNQLARLAGVGRGADLILYALVVAFLSSTVTTYVRFRALEQRYTRLARRIALDEAGPAVASIEPSRPHAVNPPPARQLELPSDHTESTS